MGDATLYNFLLLHDLMPSLQTETDVYVVVLGNIHQEAIKIIELLRDMEIKAAVDFSDRRVDKQLKMAAKKKIRYVLFIGNDELTSGLFKLKDLVTGEEQTHSIERIASIIKDYRQ
jgi:histidyl-tRNA synthetase